MPRRGKGRRHARLSAGMLVHSNQVGEGKRKLSKLAEGAGLAPPRPPKPCTICSGRPKGRPYRDKHGVERTRPLDRKSTRLNSSYTVISYAVFCLKKKKM